MAKIMKFKKSMRTNVDQQQTKKEMVEISGFEPLTPCLQGRCSTN